MEISRLLFERFGNNILLAAFTLLGLALGRVTAAHCSSVRVARVGAGHGVCAGATRKHTSPKPWYPGLWHLNPHATLSNELTGTHTLLSPCLRASRRDVPAATSPHSGARAMSDTSGGFLTLQPQGASRGLTTSESSRIRGVQEIQALERHALAARESTAST